MPIRVSQQQFVQNWQTGTQGAQNKYTTGVQNTSDWAGPTVAAQAQALAAIQDAFSSGRWAQGVQNTGTTGWKNATVAKASNWYAGVSSTIGQQHMQQGAATLYGYLNNAMNAVDALPRGSLSQNLARANAFATSMYNQKRGL